MMGQGGSGIDFFVFHSSWKEAHSCPDTNLMTTPCQSPPIPTNPCQLPSIVGPTALSSFPAGFRDTVPPLLELPTIISNSSYTCSKV